MLPGAALALTGAVGIVRMPDFYTRLHPAGKSDTLAQALILGGLMFQADDWTIVAKLALLSLFLFVTAPTATHAITKAAQLDQLEPWTPAGSDQRAKSAREPGAPHE